MPVICRRQLLAALGMSGAAAALGVPRRARADSEAPKRLVVFSTNHGTPYDAWKLRPTGKPTDQEWVQSLTGAAESELSALLSPLWAHRDRLTVLDGVSMTSAELDLAGYRHEKGWLHAWTGAWAYLTGDDLYATAPSLDQIVAAAISRPDRLASLELSVESGRQISHAGLASPLPRESSPLKLYERLFGRMLQSDPLLSLQGSALDLARAEYDALVPKLGPADRERLQGHFDLVRDLEVRLAGMAAAECDVPAVEDFSGQRNYGADFEMMVELTRLALSCDLTRVVTLSMGDLPAADFGWASYLSGDVHFDFAHRIYEDEDAMQAMIDYGRHHAQQFAALLSALASTPDIDGRSLLDNTLVVWGNELGDGWHGYHRYCTLMAGGSWYFEPGRYLHWPTGGTPASMMTPEGSADSGIPHHHLLVSVARAMGVETDAVGLTEVRTPQGERIDLTGEIPELRA
jgi:hypothetical protein